MADYNPWQGNEMMQQGLASASQQVPGIVAYRHENEQVDPQVAATARAMMHMMQGGDPVEAAHKAKAHMMNPAAADQIWGHPDRQTWEQTQFGPAQGAQPDASEGQATTTQSAPTGRTTQIQTPHGPISITRPQSDYSPSAGLATAAPQPMDVPDLPGEGLNAPMTNKQLSQFQQIAPTGTAIAGQRAAEARLEERLASNEAVKKEDRDSREKIAGAREARYGKEFAAKMDFNEKKLRADHDAAMARVYAMLQGIKTHAGTSIELGILANAERELSTIVSARKTMVSSDMSIMGTPEMQQVLHETDDVDRLHKEIQQRKAALEGQLAKGGKGSSGSSQAAPPSVQGVAAGSLQDIIAEEKKKRGQ